MSPVNRGISFHQSLLHVVHRLIDAAAICLTVHLSLRHTAETGLPDLLAIAAFTILVHHAVAELSGLYRSWRGSRLRREIGCVLLTWACAVPVLLGIGLLTRYNAEFSYETKLVWLFHDTGPDGSGPDRAAEDPTAAAGPGVQHAELRGLRRE